MDSRLRGNDRGEASLEGVWILLSGLACLENGSGIGSQHSAFIQVIYHIRPREGGEPVSFSSKDAEFPLSRE